MATIQSGVVSPRTGISPIAKVDDNNNLAVRIGPFDVGAQGAFRVGLKSGAVTGTGVVADAPLFSMRWTDSTKIAVVTRIKAVLDVTTILTAVQELGLNAIVARAFTASDSAGTAVTFASNSSNKMRSTMANSLVGDMRIASTTLLTAGTRVLDTNPFAISNYTLDRNTNATAGTAALTAAPPQAVLDFAPQLANGEWPIVLSQNEGLLIRNAVALPAAGVFTMTLELSWLEVNAWP